jgi:hypothetical protein
VNKPLLMPPFVERKDLRALRARWSDTVRYEIYLLVGDRHDILQVERAVFEMLVGRPGRAEDIREAHIADVVACVCEEYGGPPWCDRDVYCEMYPEPEPPEEESDEG